jgi:hypothetical protein
MSLQDLVDGVSRTEIAKDRFNSDPRATNNSTAPTHFRVQLDTLIHRGHNTLDLLLVQPTSPTALVVFSLTALFGTKGSVVRIFPDHCSSFLVRRYWLPTKQTTKNQDQLIADC